MGRKQNHASHARARKRGTHRNQRSMGELRAEIRQLNDQIEPFGLRVRDVEGDGNCLFRAVADQMYGTPENYKTVRQQTMDYIEQHGEFFSAFIEDDESFEDYISRMRKDGEWGGNIELQGLSLYYSYDIIIHAIDQPRMEIRNMGTKGVMHLSYLQGEHYGSARPTDGADAEKQAKIWRKTVSANVAENDPPEATKNKKKGKPQRNNFTQDSYVNSNSAETVPDDMVQMVTSQLDEDSAATYDEVVNAIISFDYDLDAAVQMLYARALEREQDEADQRAFEVLQVSMAERQGISEDSRIQLEDFEDGNDWCNPPTPSPDHSSTSATTTTYTPQPPSSDAKKAKEKEQKEREKRERNKEKVLAANEEKGTRKQKMTKQQAKRERAKEKNKEDKGTEDPIDDYDLFKQIHATAGITI